jgi:hypothetical protein
MGLYLDHAALLTRVRDFVGYKAQGTCTAVYGAPNTTITATNGIFGVDMVGDTLLSLIAGTWTPFQVIAYTSATVVVVSGDASGGSGLAFRVVENVQSYIDSGYAEFLSGAWKDAQGRERYHRWSFLHPWDTLTIWPDTVTGAVTVSGVPNTTCTVAANTFYPSMVGRTMTAATSGTAYIIVGYTSAKVVTVNTSAAADTGRTFSIDADGLYALPDDCEDVERPFTYPEGSGLRRISRWSEGDIRHAREAATQTGDPYAFALLPRRAIGTSYDPQTHGTRYDVLFYPTPSDVRVLTYRKKVRPDALDGSTYVYPLGGQTYSEVVLALCLAQAEARLRTSMGAYYRDNRTPPQRALADRAMVRAVLLDTEQSAAGNLGRSMAPRSRRWSSTPDVTHPY